MRIIGLMIVGPGEADRYLDRSLEQLHKVCDGALIVANNVDKATETMLKRSGFSIRVDNREWGIYQPNIKEDAVKAMESLKPDWVVSIDADEVFNEMTSRKKLEELAETEALAWYFYVIDHWNTESLFQKSLSFWNIRFWKYEKALKFEFENKSLHCGLAPAWAYKHGSYAPCILRHFGLMKPEDRQRKVERYEKYDPDAKFKSRWYYDMLKSTAPPDEYRETDILNELTSEVSTHKKKNPKLAFMQQPNQEFVYMKREDGRVIDIPKKHLEMTKKQHPLWKVLSEATGAVDVEEAPVVPQEEQDGIQDEKQETEETQQPAEPVEDEAPRPKRKYTRRTSTEV